MAEPNRSQLPWPFHRTGAIKMMMMSPMLARNSSKPVSRYLLRNCKAAIGAHCDGLRSEFQSHGYGLRQPFGWQGHARGSSPLHFPGAIDGGDYIPRVTTIDKAVLLAAGRGTRMREL